MYDHVKPTIREFNPNHIILHVGTNELKSSKTASQISKSVIDLALSLKSETNAVTISLIVPRKDNLNNKAQEVNSRLINMCGERDITFIDHTDTIDTERHLNESKVHLNKSGTIEFAKNVFEFLLQQDWYSADNSGNTALGSEKSSTVSGVSNSIPEHNHEVSLSDSFRNSGRKSVQGDQIFKEPYEIPSNLNRGAHPEPHKALENIRRKNILRLILAQLNKNSQRNKFEPQQHIISKNIDVLLISEAKIDSSFPSVQFCLESYATPYRLNRSANGGGILLYIREDIPSKLLNTDLSVEGFFVEIRLRKKTGLLCSSGNPRKNLIVNHLNCIGINLDSQLGQYENFIPMGDFNVEPNDATEKFLSDLRLQKYCQR